MPIEGPDLSYWNHNNSIGGFVKRRKILRIIIFSLYFWRKIGEQESGKDNFLIFAGIRKNEEWSVCRWVYPPKSAPDFMISISQCYNFKKLGKWPWWFARIWRIVSFSTNQPVLLMMDRRPRHRERMCIIDDKIYHPRPRKLCALNQFSTGIFAASAFSNWNVLVRGDFSRHLLAKHLAKTGQSRLWSFSDTDVHNDKIWSSSDSACFGCFWRTLNALIVYAKTFFY